MNCNVLNRGAPKSCAAFALALALVLVQAFAPSRAGAAAIAMVSDVQGKAATIVGSTRSALALLSDLEPGAQVELDAGARVVLLYVDGSGEYVLTGPALVAVRAPQPQTIRGAPAQKRSVLGGKAGSDVRLKPLGAVQGALVMRSIGTRSRIRLLNPGGTRTLDASPEFRWQVEQAGLTYHFELADETGNTLYESDVSGSSLRLPASVKLRENAAYSWTVSTRMADGRKDSSTSDFSIVPASVRQQVVSLRPAAGAEISDRVAYAAWLEQLELKDEARPIWRALAAERPNDERLQTLARE